MRLLLLLLLFLGDGQAVEREELPPPRARRRGRRCEPRPARRGVPHYHRLLEDDPVSCGQRLEPRPHGGLPLLDRRRRARGSGRRRRGRGGLSGRRRRRRRPQVGERLDPLLEKDGREGPSRLDPKGRGQGGSGPLAEVGARDVEEHDAVEAVAEGLSFPLAAVFVAVFVVDVDLVLVLVLILASPRFRKDVRRQLPGHLGPVPDRRRVAVEPEVDHEGAARGEAEGGAPFSSNRRRKGAGRARDAQRRQAQVPRDLSRHSRAASASCPPFDDGVPSPSSGEPETTAIGAGERVAGLGGRREREWEGRGFCRRRRFRPCSLPPPALHLLRPLLFASASGLWVSSYGASRGHRESPAPCLLEVKLQGGGRRREDAPFAVGAAAAAPLPSPFSS